MPESAAVELQPHAGPQRQFCLSRAYEVLYGGSAGGGKSFALLLESLRYAHVPGYQAIILRRTYPALERSHIIDSQPIFRALGGIYRVQQRRWTFPKGATIAFGHLEHDTSVHDYQSAEYAYIAFDELTEFTEHQYRYLQSRLRTTARDPATGERIPVRLRAATNPGGQGHDWVKARWAAWLDESHSDPAESGEKRWYMRDGEDERQVERGTPGALSRQFIRARLEDNPTLLEVDPGYADRLSALSRLERLALKYGRWDLSPEGEVFHEEWLQQTVERAPDGLRWFRYYDLAASTKERASRTATIAGAHHDGTLYLRGGWAGRIEWPAQVQLIRRLMLEEAADTAHGIEAKLHGLAMVQQLRTAPELASVEFRGIDVDKDKLSRALVWSALAEEGRVVWVTGGEPGWIRDWIAEAVAFDGSGRTFDDRVDAISGVCQMIGLHARRPAFGIAEVPRRPAVVRGTFGQRAEIGKFSGRR